MITEKLDQIWVEKKPFLQDGINLTGFSLSLVLNLASWAVIYFKLNPGLSNILLHYNAVYGADLIGPGVYAYTIPAGALILLMINLIIASAFYQKEKLSAYFFAYASIAVQLIFLAAAIVLAVINNA